MLTALQQLSPSRSSATYRPSSSYYACNQIINLGQHKPVVSPLKSITEGRRYLAISATPSGAIPIIDLKPFLQGKRSIYSSFLLDRKQYELLDRKRLYLSIYQPLLCIEVFESLFGCPLFNCSLLLDRIL